MNNFIEHLISDTHHGSTVLFKQTLKYFLDLNDDKLQSQIKLSCQRLANHFQFMGLFQNLNTRVQKIQSSEELICYLQLTQSQLLENKNKIKANVDKTIMRKCTPLTISHSSLVREVVKEINHSGKLQQVFCIRSLPANEGKILVNEFRDFDINAVLIEDNEYQSLKRNIDMIIVGCDLLSKNYFINKKGTQNLMHWAKKHNIQTWIVGDFLRFITKYNEPTKENNLFEKIDYKDHMNILCEKGLIKIEDNILAIQADFNEPTVE